MARWTWLLAAALAMAPVFADNSVQIQPLNDVPDWLSSANILFEISAGSPEAAIQYSVSPLTSVQGVNGSAEQRNSIYISGNIVLVTEANYINLQGSGTIAYLSCDDMNSSFIDQNMMLNSLMNTAPSAILLYSLTANACILNSNDAPGYSAIFTMIDQKQAAMALNLTQSGSGATHALITGNANGSQADDGPSSGNNSAIAMSILYSITGLITLLFLVIIATGAIRAHRNPERYGPRSAYGGRPRQSRAKGIARAMLETIPIVKFGDPTPAKPDPNIELESVPSHTERNGGNAGQDGSGLSAVSDDAQAHHLSTIPEDAEAHHKATENQRSAAGAAATAAPPDQKSGIGAAGQAPSGSDSDDHLGCSICTEDFNVGEDVRVLPCNHKFHPACIDPWLVNVSGTCPLCRLDLRPNASEGAEGAEGSADQANLPPPLDAEETGPAGSSAVGQQRHRSSRLFDLSRLRHASVEERIEVLRRYRTEAQMESQAGAPVGAQAGAHETEAADDEHSRSAKLTRRLRDKFRIRTRAQSPGNSGNNRRTSDQNSI